MKKIYFSLLILLCVGMSACKQELLKVDVEKTFVETNVKPPDNPMMGNKFILTLRPDGKAGILTGGDIMRQGTYKIDGSSLVVEEEKNTYKFEILSATELKKVDNGAILKLE
ncbi:hypothetical protein SAMN05421820_102145 [Pedobacter steynii]|uniref:Lipoprotein n=1 Tax=Pedobacter steynii TaxID=430522 RepID=A0A1G9MWK4_9SPHI|nr:hypothetical protein [Pedobacter steynii]NQX39474.1 hypothetical protein [Pedobacter steynii]SDL78662.1 hypothetical protein SAMN05421820_102145 [Pedobacter steynii]